MSNATSASSATAVGGSNSDGGAISNTAFIVAGVVAVAVVGLVIWFFKRGKKGK